MTTLAISPHTSTKFPFRFVLVAFAWSWLWWIPATLAERGMITLPIPAGLLEISGGFGPLLAAFVLTWVEAGGPGVRALAGQALRWRVALFWYGVALLGPFLYQLVAMGLHVLLGGQPPELGSLLAQVPDVLINFVLVFFLIGVAEEFGWRGYLLPRLQGQTSALLASLVVGVIWAAWHLPLFFNPGTSYIQTPFAVWLIFLLPYSVIHTWLYNSTRASLLLAIALHAMVNVTGSLWMSVPDVGPVVETTPGIVAQIYLLQAAVLWVLAGVILLVTSAQNLARQPRQVSGPAATAGVKLH